MEDESNMADQEPQVQELQLLTDNAPSLQKGLNTFGFPWLAILTYYYCC